MSALKRKETARREVWRVYSGATGERSSTEEEAEVEGVMVNMSAAEEADWKRRKEEAEKLAQEQGVSTPATEGEEAEEKQVDTWRWTLNWDDICPGIVVGSCPRSEDDVDVLAAESGATAILCLQCDMCFEALKIPWQRIRRRAGEKGLVMTRVAIRDFDHDDQARMLPEAVRQLGALIKMNHTVYVHCTAGINRATLTVLGYLTFVKGMDLEDAHELIVSRRSVAHPYIDCWKTVHARLLDGRGEEVGERAQAVYTEREDSGVEHGDGSADWYRAEKEVLAESFNRLIDADVQFAEGFLAAHNGRHPRVTN